MSTRLLAIMAGLGGWLLLCIWAEMRFRKLTEGRVYKRKSFSLKLEHLETDDPVVKQAHRQRTYIIYGSFAAVFVSLLILFPDA